MVLNSCETTFSCITYPLRHILSIFLEASKDILDVVFLYFRLLDFTTNIFALQHMSGKKMIRQKVGWHVSLQSATAHYHAKPLAQ